MTNRRHIPETAQPKGSTIEEKRRHHPRAYERWLPEEEARLRQLHEQGFEPKEMAAKLGRQLGGVRSRLIKLGLVDVL
jgi:DNA-directed RNA polymerase specialized sigma24 family protein